MGYVFFESAKSGSRFMISEGYFQLRLSTKLRWPESYVRDDISIVAQLILGDFAKSYTVRSVYYRFRSGHIYANWSTLDNHIL
jgi:hypothetical protein